MSIGMDASALSDGDIAAEWRVTENGRRAKYYSLTNRGARNAGPDHVGVAASDHCDLAGPQGLTRRAVMRALRRFRHDVRARTTDHDLSSELDAFLEASVAHKIQSGMSREEATRAARLVYAHGMGMVMRCTPASQW